MTAKWRRMDSLVRPHRCSVAVHSSGRCKTKKFAPLWMVIDGRPQH